MPRSRILPFLMAALLAPERCEAQRNPAYYGSRPGMSARAYSGEYQATRPNVVPTFSLPVYGGYRTYYRGYYGGGSVYQQPVIVYPPAVYYPPGVYVTPGGFGRGGVYFGGF